MENYPVLAPPVPGPVWMEQLWADLTFLHWPVDPEQVAPLFPPGTRPDLFEGRTFVGLVPFVMRFSRLAARIPLPYVGAFPETNVRLYSIDDHGRHGVVFLSLETARLVVVPMTRILMGVPYTWAKMSVVQEGSHVRYTSARRWPDAGLRSAVTVNIGEPTEPTPLEIWLTARWGAHTRKAGRTWWVPNEHRTWPLHTAEIVDLADDLVNVGPVGERLRPLFSPGVRSRFGRPSA